MCVKQSRREGERERVRGDKRSGGREGRSPYPGQNNYLPFLHAGGTFSPLKTWEGEPPLEVCELPPTGRVRTRTRAYIHASHGLYAYVVAFYIHRGIPHPLDEHYRVPARPRQGSRFMGTARRKQDETDR